MATSHSYSMYFSKQVALPCCSKLWSECWLIKGVWLQIRILYATAVEIIWAKQCTKTCKTLIYSNFEAFDFTFDMHLLHTNISLCAMVYNYFYAYFRSIYNVNIDFLQLNSMKNEAHTTTTYFQAKSFRICPANSIRLSRVRLGLLSGNSLSFATKTK